MHPFCPLHFPPYSTPLCPRPNVVWQVRHSTSRRGRGRSRASIIRVRTLHIHAIETAREQLLNVVAEEPAESHSVTRPANMVQIFRLPFGQQRIYLVRDANLCCYCFGPGHRAISCPRWETRCGHLSPDGTPCQHAHNVVLHRAGMIFHR